MMNLASQSQHVSKNLNVMMTQSMPHKEFKDQDSHHSTNARLVLDISIIQIRMLQFVHHVPSTSVKDVNGTSSKNDMSASNAMMVLFMTLQSVTVLALAALFTNIRQKDALEMNIHKQINAFFPVHSSSCQTPSTNATFVTSRIARHVDLTV